MQLKLCTVGCIAIIAFFSCSQKNTKDDIDESLMVPPAEIKTSAPVAVDSSLQKTLNVQSNNPNIMPANAITPAAQSKTVSFNPQVATQPAVQGATPTTAPGMNPPHGQPGHRCDINVGAPLNSKPVPPATTAPVSTVPASSIGNTTATAPGMNPPHGQPGHRCDISVGAPLNSKPAAPITTNITPVPAKVDSAKN